MCKGVISAPTSSSMIGPHPTCATDTLHAATQAVPFVIGVRVGGSNPPQVPGVTWPGARPVRALLAERPAADWWPAASCAAIAAAEARKWLLQGRPQALAFWACSGAVPDR